MRIRCFNCGKVCKEDRGPLIYSVNYDSDIPAPQWALDAFDRREENCMGHCDDCTPILRGKTEEQ